MTPVVLTTDHPAWTSTSNGDRARVVDTGAGVWTVGLSAADLASTRVEDAAGGQTDTGRGPQLVRTAATELPAGMPADLRRPLVEMGTVARWANPSLWDAITTAILRQVVRAEQARKVYRSWCTSYGRTVATEYGPLSLAPSPQAVLALDEAAFGAVGTAFHRSALQAAATAFLAEGNRWSRLPLKELVVALDDIPRVGPWTAAAAAADFSGDFSIYPHDDLAVRTWATRAAPELGWPTNAKAFSKVWTSMAPTPGHLHALTLFTLTWGSHAPAQHVARQPQPA